MAPEEGVDDDASKLTVVPDTTYVKDAVGPIVVLEDELDEEEDEDVELEDGAVAATPTL